MSRTLNIRATAMALALVSSTASIGRAQRRAPEPFARADAATPTPATTRDARAPALAPSEQLPRGPGNFYIGIAAGASLPSGDFRDLYRDGWSATVPIGWHPENSPLGMRLDVAYSRWGGETIGGVKLQSAAVWDGMLDATLDMPFGTNRTSAFYLVGGGGVHYFPKYGGDNSSVSTTPTPGDTTTTTPPIPPGGYPQINSASSSSVTVGDRSSTARFGLNGGAGFSFGLPQGSAIFIETRYVSVFTEHERTNYWPIVGGIRWTMR